MKKMSETWASITCSSDAGDSHSNWMWELRNRGLLKGAKLELRVWDKVGEEEIYEVSVEDLRNWLRSKQI